MGKSTRVRKKKTGTPAITGALAWGRALGLERRRLGRLQSQVR